MATPDAFPSVPFDEAIAALKRRGINLVPSDHWAEVWQQTHQSMFTVARSAGFAILNDIHAELVRVLAEGRTFRDFGRDLTPILQKKGWWGKTLGTNPETGELREIQLGSLRRLRTIYDTNLRVSQAQGEWERIQKHKKLFPYLRYVGILDNRIRPQHRLWHDVILPVDHPWWKTHFPPNGWRCRCWIVQLTEADLITYGLTVTDIAPDDGVVQWRNPATGEIVDVPRGIDPGWAYNPGAVDQTAYSAKIAMDKLVTLPPAIGAEAVAALAFAFPQVERELGNWLEGITAKVASGIFRPTGERRVVGCLPDDVTKFLAKQSIGLASAAVAVADNDIIHALRSVKVAPLPMERWHRLPSLLAEPAAIFWDKQNPGLVYVLDDAEGKGKLVVLINYETRVNRKDIQVNTVRTGKRIENLDEFENRGRYERIK